MVRNRIKPSRQLTRAVALLWWRPVSNGSRATATLPPSGRSRLSIHAGLPKRGSSFIVVVHIRFVNLSTRDAPNRRSQPMRATHQRHYPKQASRTMRKANPLAGLFQ